jgi:hypothetical protein
LRLDYNWPSVYQFAARVPIVEMILLDWTRMGRSYCLAGVTAAADGYRVVRPLPVKYYGAPVANVGWSPFLFDGHARFEVFELVNPQPARHPAPHLEDIWVGGLRPCRRVADARQRQAVLAATKPPPQEPLFGAPLQLTAGAAQLRPGVGARSLATLWVPAGEIVFHGSHRLGSETSDFRVRLGVAGLGERLIPVKDHPLLLRAEQAGAGLDHQVRALRQIIGRMGDPVVVRLGLSRPYQSGVHNQTGPCWLMADGFFSLSDPQP